MNQMLVKSSCLIFLFLTSCHLPSYISQGTKNAQLDFSKGHWLLAEMNTTSLVNKNELEKMTNKAFEALLQENLTKQIDAKGLLVSHKVNLDNIETHLKDFKNNQPYDYLIFIEAKILKDELGNVVVGQSIGLNENKTILTLNVYDLNLQTQIYSHSIVSFLSIQDQSSNLSFAKNTDMMLQKSLKRLLKRIKTTRVTS